MSNIIIVLSGDLGAGKSTIARLIADRIDAKIYSTGKIMRTMAEEMGIPFVEFSKYAETHHEIDHRIDEATIRLAENLTDNILIDSRMAWHFVPNAFSVYMMVRNVEAARRIMAAARPEEQYESLEHAVSCISARRASEKQRYAQLYNVRLDDLNNYDYVIDTTMLTPDEVTDAILNAYNAHLADPRRRIEICPAYIRLAEMDGDVVRIGGTQDAYYTVSGGRLVAEAQQNNAKTIPCEYVLDAEANQ